MLSSPCKIIDKHYQPDSLSMQYREKLNAIERIQRSQPIDQIQQIQQIQKIQRNRHPISPTFDEMVKKRKDVRKESKKRRQRNADKG